MSTLRHAHGQDVPVASLVARDVAAKAAGYPFEEKDDPRRAERELGRFAFKWVLAILQQMGVMRDGGEAHDLDQLRQRLGIAPKYLRYFDALIRKLQEEGLVTVDGRSLEATARVRDHGLRDVEAQVAAFQKRFRKSYPGCTGLLSFMACCLNRFAEIITGRIDVADVLFQDADMDVFAAAFSGDVVADYFNRLVADSVRSTVERLRDREGPKVRIVEIGAGTGGTTAAILEALQPLAEAVELVFSDISLSFVRYARRRFSARYPWVDYGTLNIEKDLSQQGFEARSFDVVVAANVLHDTRDIEHTLEQTRRLLKPGGLLVLNEFTSVKDCLFFSGALLHGYWLFADPDRRLQDSCLLSVPQWRRVLERTGFTVAGSLALPTQSPGPECSQSVMLCAASQTGGGAVAELPAASAATSGIIGKLIEQDILALLGEERAAAYSAQRPLMEMGLDSIELVELKSLVRGQLGVKLPSAFLFEHQTQEKMAQALTRMVPEEQLRELLPQEPLPQKPGDASNGRNRLAAPDVPAVPAAGQAAEEGAVAIVGVACRFPGGATSPEDFWKLLECGEHGITSLPAERWQWPDFVDVAGRHKGIDQGGFLKRIDEFDARFFRTSPKEAELMDPQQRLLLELSWEAIEDGGHRASELAGRKVGIFVGVCQSDYRDVLVASCGAAEGYVGSGSAYSMLANRLSYFYDFKGPSLTVDTACSSSLFALHAAVTAIRRGECEQALVGAVNLLCSPTISISYYEAGMLSPTGRCRTFDETADGYVRGEGGAMLLLKPLAFAIEHGDAIYGLVKGTAVNHGGQAASLTAPKPEAQAEVIEAAWLQAGAAPDSIGYIETHGTGTKLGDPIEISGLTEALRRLYRAQGKSWPATPHCWLGSVKSNVGHLEGAAGLAGLLKILMSIRHRQIPRTLHFRRLNPEIDLVGSPFSIVERNEAWPSFRDEQGRQLPRRAGVSSFGFGGANSHAVIEEHPSPSADAAAEDRDVLIPLSAWTQEQLLERAKGLLDFLERLDRRAGTNARPTCSSLDGVLESLRSILRRRFDLGEVLTPDLEWVELGWDAMDTRLFLAAVEEAHGLRLHFRALIEHPNLGSLAEGLVRHQSEAPPGLAAGESVPGARLEDVAYTLQVGREPMSERVVFLVGAREELASALCSFVAGHDEIPNCYRGYARPPQDGAAAPPAGEETQDVDASLASRDLPQLASLWVRGVEIDWAGLYPASRPRRVHLPTYPFARERYWVSGARAPERPGPARPGQPASHPLLNQRSSLPEYRFSTLLTGSEFFLAAHVIQGQRLLPAVAYLEMARAAVARAESLALGDRIWLRSVAWVRPLAVGRHPAQVHLRLHQDDGGDLSFEIHSRAEAATGDETFYAQGRAGTGTAGVAPVLNVAELRAQCTRVHYSAEDCYRAFAAMGYDYGPAQRGIDALYMGANEILAKLKLPACLAQTLEQFVLHPTMADSAVQATIGFSLAGGRSAHHGARPALPFELASAEVFGACTPVMWAAIRRSDAAQNGDGAGVFDIDLCDETGRLSARFRGLATRPAVPDLVGEPPSGEIAGEMIGEMTLTPTWEPVQGLSPDAAQPPGPTAIVGGTDPQRAALQQHCPGAKPLMLEAADSIEEMRRKIVSWGEIGHLLWLVPHHGADSLGDDSLIAAQHHGVIFGFRLIKAMLAAGYGSRPLTWSVITTGTQAVNAGEIASPTHASVHGLIGSMAKEHADWSVRLMDLPAAGEWPWRDLLAISGDPHGNPWVYRHRRWYRQQLVPYHQALEAAAAYRPGGVYVVIGGAGGVGEVWSEALLRRMPVQLVWIGRRPKDDAIQARLARLATLGPAPLYLAADATDREQLAGAREAIKQAFGRIDGVIHAAIVLQDRSLANLTEDELRAGLSPKVDVCVRLAQVFGGEPLDFVLFFSSMLALLKWPGQSNYVAGCTFKDAFAQRLAAEWPSRVRVINWGYWGGIGAAASERHQSLMARRGFGSIELSGAMQALDRLLAGPVTQLAYVTTSEPTALAGVDVQPAEGVTRYEPALPSCIGAAEQARLAEWRLSPAWSQLNGEIEEAFFELLWAQLQSLRLFSQEALPPVEMRTRAGIPERFAQWLERSIEDLEARGFVARSGEALRASESRPADAEGAWRSWERRKGEWLREDDWRAQVQLAEAALHALPDVLTGRRAATDVLVGDLLTDSSTSLVGEVYRQGEVARFCNEALAAVVASYVAERRRRDPHCRIRILEIGAGTGATSELVFQALSAHESCVVEYAFTDISRAFLAAAMKALPYRPAYLKYQAFDVETPPAEQGVALDGYDLVIATNVLHATKDIVRTLRNAKAVLRTNGLIVCNEIAANTLFHHLTFGLLDGWWLFADPELRIAGGPALRPETWKAVLEQEGFRAVSFPAAAAHAAGQQVLVAESDGLVRQRRAVLHVHPRPRQQEAVEERRSDQGIPVVRDLDATAAKIAEIMGGPRDVATAHLSAYLRLRVAETLGADQASLDSRSRPFTDALLGEFGMDSLSSNSLRNALRREIGVDIGVQRIIADKVHRIVESLYEQLLLKHVSNQPRPQEGEETETFVF